MGKRSRVATRLAALSSAVLLSACGGHVPPTLHPADAPPERRDEAPFLKVHMKSGELYLLSSWRVNEDRTRIDGRGRRYSASRQAEAQGEQSIALTDVALLESDRPESDSSGGMLALAVMTTVFGVTSIVCAANPKSCFGSCPTFYADERDFGRPLAEGFSASIARSLEARDVDALFGLVPRASREFELTMRNEAFETHAVRRVRVLAFRRPAGGRVLAAPDGRFYEAFELRPAAACRAPEGDCSRALAAWDDDERASPADPVDLATREEIALEFPPASGELGLVVGARQTLLSTFLFYQTMAHFGRGATTFLAAVERGGVAARDALGMARVLGPIEASAAEGAGVLRRIGDFDEAGPIAGDVQVLPFHADGTGPIHVRLRLAKGHWRLGYIALARLGRSVTATTVEPTRVDRNRRLDDQARQTWRRGDGHVITRRGDALRIHFVLPRPATELELFLESEGYYYEWMRSEWLAEEDPELALLSIADPQEALRRLAVPFKRHEAELEAAFWSSRFRR